MTSRLKEKFNSPSFKLFKLVILNLFFLPFKSILHHLWTTQRENKSGYDNFFLFNPSFVLDAFELGSTLFIFLLFHLKSFQAWFSVQYHLTVMTEVAEVFTQQVKQSPVRNFNFYEYFQLFFKFCNFFQELSKFR